MSHLLLTLLLLPQAPQSHQFHDSWRRHASILRPPVHENGAFFGNLSVSGERVLVGAHRANGPVPDSGVAHIYRRSGREWLLETTLAPSDLVVDDFFGWSVALSSDRAVVSAPRRNNGQGRVYVYRLQGQSWELETTINGSGGWFGRVDIEDEHLIVGAFQAGSETGYARVYVHDGEDWVLEQTLLPNDPAAYDHFGIDVALNQGRALIGARGVDEPSTDAGASYVFREEQEGTWVQEAKLLANDGGVGDLFGWHVALDMPYAVVGSRFDDVQGIVDRGSAYVYHFDGTQWNLQLPKLTGSQALAGAQFGKVSIRLPYIAVGAQKENTHLSQAGAAYLFQLVDGTWQEIKRFTAPDAMAHDEFGWLDLGEGLLGVGALRADRFGAVDSGMAYVFPLPGSAGP